MDIKNNNQIIVGMSGGVDSSAAVIILKKQGWDPIGVSLKFKNSDIDKTFIKASQICQKLNIPHHIIDARSDFKQTVVDYFIDSYQNNKTPNPCVVCNPSLKFKKLFEFARKERIKYVATGHYARLREVQSKKSKVKNYLLLRAKDRIKDQSYYLAFLPQQWLPFIQFPLGNYIKKQIYQLVQTHGFDCFKNQSSSQDFCFLEGCSLIDFLNKNINPKPGLIKDIEGHTLGRHQGLYSYTLGQRKGIRLSGGPYYVVRSEPENNVLVVSNSKYDLYSQQAILTNLHFISNKIPKKSINIQVKIRYQHQAAKAKLTPLSKTKCALEFHHPQSAITPGQFAVFYDRDICLGGGEITQPKTTSD